MEERVEMRFRQVINEGEVCLLTTCMLVMETKFSFRENKIMVKGRGQCTFYTVCILRNISAGLDFQFSCESSL